MAVGQGVGAVDQPNAWNCFAARAGLPFTSSRNAPVELAMSVGLVAEAPPVETFVSPLTARPSPPPSPLSTNTGELLGVGLVAEAPPVETFVSPLTARPSPPPSPLLTNTGELPGAGLVTVVAPVEELVLSLLAWPGAISWPMVTAPGRGLIDAVVPAVCSVARPLLAVTT